MFSFWNSLAFFMIQWRLATWSLIPLSFLNPACTRESSQFTYCWSLAWGILSITLLACELQLCSSLNILWHCPSLGWEWKLTSSGVATAELSKFAGILSAALTQHHLLGFEIAQLKFWRRQWHPTPVLLPGKPHGQRSLVGCSPWGR